MKKLADNTHSLPSALLVTLLLVVLGGCVANESKPASEPASAASSSKAEPVSASSQTAATAAEAKPACKEAPSARKKAKKSAGKGSSSGDCVPAAAAAANPAPPVVAGSYDLSKNKPVTDSTKVEAGQGTLVKGINDWQGEISGVPAAGSKFVKLKIGMSQKQVTDLVGEPTDQGAYVTGKAFIPFYFGSDKSRWEMIYKGQGRLIFSNQSGFGTGYYLTWVIHNASEGGYR